GENGYTYLTTRDGTQLAIDVHPPTSPAGEPGAPSSFQFGSFGPGAAYTPPYPTLIEYSGYGYANPAGPENGIAVLANLMGFAVAWAEQRQQNAEPAAPGHGQAWAYKRVQEGDQTCAANQDLHGEAANLLQKIKENSTYKPKVADPLDPVTFVHNINVPTFMACQWEDEQTGGHCADLVQHFTGTSKKWFTFTNGPHIDSLDPYTYDRFYDFLELYVAHKAPIENAAPVQAAAPIVY